MNFKKILRIKETKEIIVIEFLVITSTALGMILNPDYILNNFIYMITFSFVLLYYLYFSAFLSDNDIALTKVFVFMLVVSLAFAVLWVINPSAYFSFRTIWSMSGDSIEYVNAFYNRYTFIMSDPNSIGSILCSIMLIILVTENNIETWKKITVIGLTFGTVIISMSTTAVLVFVISIFLYFITNLKKNVKYHIAIKNIFSVSIIIMICGLIFYRIMVNASVDILNLAINRIRSNLSGGSFSGRIPIWKSILKSFNWFDYCILGRGNSIIDLTGNMRRPHNGHLYLVLAYGVIAYSLFLNIFFKKPKNTGWKYFIVIIPLLILFSVNTMMQDYRACLAFALIVSYYHTWVDKKKVT